ncbi:MAG TPA: branched-chain amino acid transaminase [Candidatus Baltobacteraceae bacterium]|nr:branched-chain amino acid transaminase [Candidatus Baltobacteraceae bacterium]
MTEYVWFDGQLRDVKSVAVHPFTHALHYGSGVFEGIRAYRTDRGTAIFRLHDHLERFHRSAAAYGLAIPYDVRTLADAIFSTLNANAFSDGYIRPLAFFGEKGISLAPRFHCPTHVLVALKPLQGSLIGATGGARVRISPWRKTPSGCMPSTVKACGHYMNSILALQDAVAHGCDEALLLNDRGEIAEGSGENLFIVRGGEIKTNDASADILEGITRDTVIALARDRGIPARIGPLTIDEVRNADEAFFTGTAAEVMPIARIDDRRFAAARPVTDVLYDAYAAAVRAQDAKNAAWCTFLRERNVA